MGSKIILKKCGTFLTKLTHTNERVKCSLSSMKQNEKSAACPYLI